MAGEIEAVGKNVAQCKPGDQVFGTYVVAFAEYAVSKSASGLKSPLVIKPDNLTLEQAASAPVAALTALHGLRDKARSPGNCRQVLNLQVPLRALIVAGTFSTDARNGSQ